MAADQPVLLPLPDLLRRLEAPQEWLLLPQADYQALVAAGRDPAPTPKGAAAFLASAVISAQVVDGREIALSAEFTAINRGEGPALADLFATVPARLGAIRLGGGPAVLAPGEPLRLLLPRPGRFVGTVHWTEPLVGDLHSRSARLPLPLAGGVSLTLAGDGRGSAVAAGLARDGAAWRLVAPVDGTLDLAWLPGGGGDDAPVFGLTQTLEVTQVEDGPRPLRWALELEPRRGSPPQILSVTLPAGFTCTAAHGGVARLVQVAGGVEITRSAEVLSLSLDGLLAAGAPVALPRIAGASWQGGVVSLASEAALACEPPPGWCALGGNAAGRVYRVGGPDAGMTVERLPADAGLAIATALAVAVGPERSVLEQVLLVRAGGVRLFRLPLQLPAGWRPTALSGAGVTVPPVDDLAPGSALALDLPAGLAPGAELALLFTAEAGPTPPPALPLLVPGAVRASHRLLLAAAPGLELAIDATAWRLAPDDGAGAGVRAELRRDGEATPVLLSAAPRAAAVDVDVVTWLLPGIDATWCRCDVRVAVRDGELARLDLDLPLVHDADLRLTGAGLTLGGEGPFTISAAKAWRGERVLRLEGRLRPDAAGKLPLATARLPGAARQPVLRRWAALQAPGDRDLQLAPAAAARPIDADELPTWASAIPGASVVAAWRLGEGEAGGWRSADRALAPLPSGFIDGLELASQISPEATRSRLACRLAAPGLAELDLGLPEGAVLEQAALDGIPAAVRRDGQRLLLALPGRTLVQVVLRYAVADTSGRLPLPRLGDLPVTRCSWTVAVDPALRAVVLAGPSLMPLSPGPSGPLRPWLGDWSPADGASALVGPGLVPFVAAASADPRALTLPTPPGRPVRAPSLTLHGQMFSGTRSGAPQAVALVLTPLAELHRADFFGRILALLGCLVAVLVPRRGLRLVVPLALAAIPLSLALLVWQTPCGPLLALAEWLPLAVALGVAGRWLRLPSAIPVLLVLAGSLASAEPLRLMGYDRLDAEGRPQGVVVALPRADFDALWARAHGPSRPAAPPVVLGLSPPVFALRLVGTSVEGVLELAVVVPGPDWQELRLPLPGAVRSLEVKAVETGAAPRHVTWRAEDGQLVLSLEGGQQAVLSLAFTLPTSEAAGGRRCVLALAPGLGGRLSLSAPAPWRALAGTAGSLALVGEAADLPTAGGPVEFGWDLPAEVAPVDSRLSAEQRLSLALEAGRLAWSAELDLTSAGAPLNSVRLVPPAGLVLAEIAGEGLATWRHDGAVVVVTWAGPAASRHLRLAGVVPRSGGSGSAAVALVVSGAAVSRGRLGLAGAVGERFLRPAGLANAQPAAGEALAGRWDDQPAALTVAWEEIPRELSVQRTVAVVCGEGRARACAVLTLAGRGSCDGLRLALPAPWRVTTVVGAATWAVSGTEAGRDLLVAGTSPWTAGSTITVRLEADRSALGASPALPLLGAHGPGLVAGRLRLAVADAGSLRVHLDAGEARALAPEMVAQELAGSGLALAPGERWRSAAELDAAARPTLSLGSEAVQAAATLSHYLILGRDGVRWSLHLRAEPVQGALPGLALTLPEGARLVAVSGLGLGRWTLDGRILNLAWAAPTAAAAAIDLELDVPAVADGSLRLGAPQLAGLLCRQQIALVEEDDLGLVRREAEGLGELEQPIAGLPDGVERSQVRLLWKATRADWTLRLSREPLAATAGADGLATLVDGAVTVAPDGELRGLATWHLVNRTRQQLPLILPAGVELWEARVDGQAVRVRRDADGALWLPVPPLRPGQASTRVALVWRAGPQAGGRIRLAPPALGGLKLIASTWRLAAPAGWTLERRGGSLQEADPADAAADRAQAVIDEIQRLQAVEGLNEAGLKRLEGQLAVLDSELKDHLASLGRRAGPTASALGLSKISTTSKAISDNSQRLGALQNEISANYGQRSSRRKQLNIDALNQSWDAARQTAQPVRPARPSALDEPQRLVPAAWPWDAALAPGSAGGLGAGQAPPGLVAGGGTALSGIELVAEPSGAVLVLRGQGSALDAELVLRPQSGSILPWVLLACAGLVLVAAGLVLRRRA